MSKNLEKNQKSKNRVKTVKNIEKIVKNDEKPGKDCQNVE